MLDQLLTCVMDIGEQLLINGAEIYRVEECINRIFNAYEVKRIDTFIITTCMIVSVYDSDGNVYTQTRRINSTVTDIEKLDKFNNLSREICKYKPAFKEINDKVSAIANTKTYSLYMKIIANAVIASSFTMFFGGSITEAIFSFFIGALMQVVLKFLNGLHTNKLFEKLIGSFVVSFLTYLVCICGFVDNVDKIIIGNIMSMIPGIGFTNALRDLFKGDIFTGVHRTIESLLISASIAAGYIITAMIFGGGLL